MEEQYNKEGLRIFHELNALYIQSPPEEDLERYQSLCREKFATIDKDENLEQILSDLSRRHYYKQISIVIPSTKIRNKNDLLAQLQDGNLQITEYGRAFIDRMDVINIIHTERNSLLQVILREKTDFEKIKENLIIQVIMLMGVFVAIIVFIFQGIWLTTKTDFLDKCFIQQISSAFSFYLPLLITILFIIGGCFFFFLIKRYFNEKRWE